MDTANIPLLKAITQRMGYLNAQQRVIAENVANADTPGYKAQALVEPDFSSILAQVNPRAAAMRGTVARPSIDTPEAFSRFGSRVGGKERRQEKVFETKPTGNNVVIEEQLMKMSDVQIEYSALSNLYRKQMGLMKVALGKSR